MIYIMHLCIMYNYLILYTTVQRALEVWGTMEALVEKQQRKKLLENEEKRRRKGDLSYHIVCITTIWIYI